MTKSSRGGMCLRVQPSQASRQVREAGYWHWIMLRLQPLQKKFEGKLTLATESKQKGSTIFCESSPGMHKALGDKELRAAF